MFEGFTLTTVETSGTSIRLRHGGSGPPLLLLHGHPQTHVMWHEVAARLSGEFTLVAMDLRGYGDSGKPPTTPDHAPYSKRAMAQDAAEVMSALGFERFGVCGHDRGGQVAFRLALDEPERVSKLATLAAVPPAELWRRADARFALAWWHWFFLAQPAPLPENLLGANPDAYYFRGTRHLFAPQALEAYLKAVHDPATRHGMIEDYRAGATIDREIDEADRGVRRVGCPVLTLWGTRDYGENLIDVPGAWREWANDVSGRALECGHYLAEERPDEVAAELRAIFFA